MDELATTVSDILNQTAGGIGDISEWLASDGLPGYAAVSIARNAVVVVMCALIIALCVAVFRWGLKNEIDCFDSPVTLFGSVAACFAIIACALLLAFSIPDLVGWLVSPDGMLLETLVSALGN